MSDMLGPLSISVGVIVAFVAQVSYDVIANAGVPEVAQNHLEAGIFVIAELMVVLFLYLLMDSRRRKI